MAKLQHPNIVALHGIMLNPLRLVMEYCPCGDLFRVLSKQVIWGGPVNVADATVVIPNLCWKITSDVARGMAYLHTQEPPIAHRDLRSPNVFLMSLDADAPCCAKVADFGSSVAVTSRQTVALSCWQWMAPEAQLGANYTHHCDLYLFAMVAMEVFTQRVPFDEHLDEGERVADLKGKLLKDNVRPTLPAFVPPWMRELLRDLWQPDPILRPSFTKCIQCLVQPAARRLRSQLRKGDSSVGVRSMTTRVVFGDKDGAPLCMGCNNAEVWLGCCNGDVRVFSAKSTLLLRSYMHGSSVKVACIWSVLPGTAWSGGTDGAVHLWGNAAQSPRLCS